MSIVSPHNKCSAQAFTLQDNSVTSQDPKQAFSEPLLEFHLKQYEYSQKANESRTEGSPDPGSWLFDVKRFIKWRDHNVRKLWIHGICEYGIGGFSLCLPW